MHPPSIRLQETVPTSDTDRRLELLFLQVAARILAPPESARSPAINRQPGQLNLQRWTVDQQKF